MRRLVLPQRSLAYEARWNTYSQRNMLSSLGSYSGALIANWTILVIGSFQMSIFHCRLSPLRLFSLRHQAGCLEAIKCPDYLVREFFHLLSLSFNLSVLLNDLALYLY